MASEVMRRSDCLLDDMENTHARRCFDDFSVVREEQNGLHAIDERRVADVVIAVFAKETTLWLEDDSE